MDAHYTRRYVDVCFQTAHRPFQRPKHFPVLLPSVEIWMMLGNCLSAHGLLWLQQKNALLEEERWLNVMEAKWSEVLLLKGYCCCGAILTSRHSLRRTQRNLSAHWGLRTLRLLDVWGGASYERQIESEGKWNLILLKVNSTEEVTARQWTAFLLLMGCVSHMKHAGKDFLRHRSLTPVQPISCSNGENEKTAELCRWIIRAVFIKPLCLLNKMMKEKWKRGGLKGRDGRATWERIAGGGNGRVKQGCWRKRGGLDKSAVCLWRRGRKCVSTCRRGRDWEKR